MTSSATVVGLGFVGLTTAAFFANRGIKVYGIDSDIERTKAIKENRIPFFEPKLDRFVKRALLSNMLVVNKRPGYNKAFYFIKIPVKPSIF